MKRFSLSRRVDVSGVSGTGIVAQGCVFDNGYVALTWLTSNPSFVWYRSVDELIAIHDHVGTDHEGGTSIVWVDE
jgi:hypothetical protein